MGNVVLQTVEELGKRGHSVEVLTPLYKDPLPETIEEQYEEPAMKEQIDYARRFTPSIQYGNAARIPKVKTLLETFDLVHLHYPFYGTANLVRQWKNRNPYTPLVITYHMDTRAPGWKGLIFKWYNKYWMPKILRSADLIIGSSEDYIDVSDARALRDEMPEKWQTLPFGVDTERFMPRERPQEVFDEIGLDISVPTVLFVGGMDRAHYFKGVSVLLKAIKRLQHEGVSLQVIMVGDGDLRESYQRQALLYGLQDTVVFLGRVEDDVLPYVYNAADVCVLPSTTRGEAFGMVLLEAMASGVPVVASDIPGVRSVAADGGLTVPPGDDDALAQAIHTMLEQSPAQKQQQSEDVRAVVEASYSWERIVDTLEIWYQELVEKRT